MQMRRTKRFSCLTALIMLVQCLPGQTIQSLDERGRRVEGRVKTLEDSVTDLKTGVKAVKTEMDDGVVPRLSNLDKSVNDPEKGLAKKVEGLDRKLSESDSRLGVTRRDLDRFWVLLAAVLVFFMQAGFMCLEVGVGRREHEAVTGLMNLMNWLVLCVMFYCVGFGFMFGSGNGFIGLNLFFPSADDVTKAYAPLGMEYLLFQLAFAATTATIVDGAIAERCSLAPYFFASCFVGGIIYPVFGHWVWNAGGWLENLGPYKFHDFAGSTVVHSVGAWIALAAVKVIGPRLGFDRDDRTRFSSYSTGYAVLGVIMLWFGWWGFNGGSRLRYDDTIASIILNTNLAGACAGIVAWWHALATEGKRGATVNAKLIGGVLGGLVAITACCDVVTPGGAMLVGIAAGFVHNYCFDLLPGLGIDDMAGAIPVHGACGIWGTICAGIAIALKPDGSPWQIGVQALGIAAAFAFTYSVSWAIFTGLEKTIGLRSSIVDEVGAEQNSLIGSYEGEVRVSVLRPGGFWGRFRAFGAYMKDVQKAYGMPRAARNHVVEALAGQRLQVIRNDDSPATPDDVTRALNHYFEPA